MDSLPIGSAQSWLDVAATALGPLIALIVGYEGADWFLRRSPVRGAITRHWRAPRATTTDSRTTGPASLCSFTRGHQHDPRQFGDGANTAAPGLGLVSAIIKPAGRGYADLRTRANLVLCAARLRSRLFTSR
jgi:hypothetical protein